jgi:hypothetical protein
LFDKSAESALELAAVASAAAELAFESVLELAAVASAATELAFELALELAVVALAVEPASTESIASALQLVFD